MAFIENFIDKTQKAGKFVCEKAVDAKDYVSYEYKLASVRSEIDGCYKELGELIYRNIEDESKVLETKHELITKINGLFAQIEELNSKASKFKKVCSVCGETSSAKAEFCSKCGNALK